MRGKHFLLVDGYAGAASKLEYRTLQNITATDHTIERDQAAYRNG
jgi:hypothetical protein